MPAGADWLHEIKHDWHRLIVQRDGQHVRLFTRNGHDWSKRFPAISVKLVRLHCDRTGPRPNCSAFLLAGNLPAIAFKFSISSVVQERFNSTSTNEKLAQIS
ncbi:hypothetical protein HAP48_0015515 [Bradyrhizobium septentrionale]|uniref:ATP-dependent DNA ligase family profile domain-containing protein n=1 Tax=Bradyrhizobium septentrionale TaxID=1404411 RepID=A0A973W9K6_9BRAD|nr:hypothetical protein [Bradyrhizobium septentrionale]UGY18733.1 hypothetical protein HAP48_0015515 [Bradyrhizobium septentrionale]UGY27464.1 hypothetical protein HU675_0012265 [Bradyrhizobium septentrionale]